MLFQELESLFDRASRFVFSKAKLAITAIVLALCGLFIISAKGLSLASNQWFSLSLAFIPLFICGAILTTLGAVLIRSYHDEVQGRDIEIKRVAGNTFQHLVASSSFFVPILLTYLLLWLLLGLFFLLKEIPIVGAIFGTILTFGPFLLILGSLLLSVICIFLLFVVAPIVALKDLTRTELIQYVQRQARQQLFLRVTLFIFSLLPFALTATLLWFAARITAIVYVDQDNTFQMLLQWFFIMIPFAAFLAPALIFFFNLAAETHILIQKRSK